MISATRTSRHRATDTVRKRLDLPDSPVDGTGGADQRFSLERRKLHIEGSVRFADMIQRSDGHDGGRRRPLVCDACHLAGAAAKRWASAGCPDQPSLACLMSASLHLSVLCQASAFPREPNSHAHVRWNPHRAEATSPPEHMKATPSVLGQLSHRCNERFGPSSQC